MERRMLTTAEAAEYLGLSMDALAKARKTGELFGDDPPPFLKLGAVTIRYKFEDVKAWADRQATQTTHDKPADG